MTTAPNCTCAHCAEGVRFVRVMRALFDGGVHAGLPFGLVVAARSPASPWWAPFYVRVGAA